MSQKNKRFISLHPECNLLLSEGLLCITSVRLRVLVMFSPLVSRRMKIVKVSMKLL